MTTELKTMKGDKDSRLNLLEGLSRDQLVDLVLAHGLCYEHLETKVLGMGYYANCLHCACVEHDHALSEIDLLILNPEPDEYGNTASIYDCDYYPEGVVKRVETFVKDSRLMFESFRDSLKDQKDM